MYTMTKTDAAVVIGAGLGVLNMFLTSRGQAPIDNDTVNQLVNAGATIVVAVAAWRNNRKPQQ